MIPMNNEIKKTKKLNNKGFSLVELIIVIAIMAVLIGVLAPQYLRYVERSRQSADIDNVDQMISACEVFSADPAHNIVTGTIGCSGGTVTPTGDVVNALADAGITTAPAMRSNAYQNWTITFAVDATTHNPTVTFSTGTGDDGQALRAALGR